MKSIFICLLNMTFKSRGLSINSRQGTQSLKEFATKIKNNGGTASQFLEGARPIPVLIPHNADIRLSMLGSCRTADTSTSRNARNSVREVDLPTITGTQAERRDIEVQFIERTGT